ncbi:hypothetical protein [Nocardia sp. CNY236]|uniref:hypothetical protein n=1 Tax=Nocardia sp. CNY236 TaxID=1169152 RepID=UPI00041EEF60|nr:hypothetical protein [Nocardia sp. CNY236]
MTERGGERVREHLLSECRRRKLEPPTAGRIARVVRSALSRGEDVLFDRVLSRLPTEVEVKLAALVVPAGEKTGELEDGTAMLGSIRSDPGNVSLNTMLTEIAKLEAVRAIGVPGEVFADIARRRYGVRDLHVPGVARSAAVQEDLGRRCGSLPQPGRRPSWRFRGTPHRALRSPAQTAGSDRIHPWSTSIRS